jgi:hypothetical protein
MKSTAILFVSIGTLVSWKNGMAQGQAHASCVDNSINAGETLESDCEDACASGESLTFDWSEVSEEDPNILNRNTVCNCTEADGFTCWDIVEVWDKSVGVLSCDVYNITSGTTCKEFCSDIDPKSYAWSTNKGEVECECADVKICSGVVVASMSILSVVGFLCLLFL